MIGIYLGIGAMAFLESLALVGLLVPGASAVAAAGAAARMGHLRFADVVLAASIGAFAGDALSYWIGTAEASSRRLHEWLARYPRALAVAREWIEHHGALAIIAGRFLPPTRALAPLVAGTMRMPIGRFMGANAIGGVLWSLAASGFGHVAQFGFEHAPKKTLLAAAIALISIGYRSWKARNRGGSGQAIAAVACAGNTAANGSKSA